MSSPPIITCPASENQEKLLEGTEKTAMVCSVGITEAENGLMVAQNPQFTLSHRAF